MTAPGQIVILNGAPRAGKTSIARAMQDGSPGLWLNIGVSAARAMTPARYQPGIGLRPGGERPDLEPVVQQIYASVFEAIAAGSRQGICVVSDFGIHDGYSRSLGIWDEMERRFAGLPVLRVGVICPIDIIVARRNAEPRDAFYAAGEGVPEPVARWQAAVHEGKRYDLTVDTGQSTPAECAAAVFSHLT